MSPIVVDLAGDGFQLSGVEDGVTFDLATLSEAPEQIAWTLEGTNDAWLSLDRDNNGLIDDGSELFGNYSDQPEPLPGRKRNGYAALGLFDTNADGVISRSDPVYADLRLWTDTNHNGISESSEMSTLESHGITGLGTDYRAHRRFDPQGNLWRFSARVYVDQSSQVGLRSFDVFLVTIGKNIQSKLPLGCATDNCSKCTQIGGVHTMLYYGTYGTCMGSPMLCSYCNPNPWYSNVSSCGFYHDSSDPLCSQYCVGANAAPYCEYYVRNGAWWEGDGSQSEPYTCISMTGIKFCKNPYISGSLYRCDSRMQ